MPLDPGSGPPYAAVPLYPLGCRKTLTPSRGVHLRMLLLGISANSKYPAGIHTGPSVHLNTESVATRSIIASFGISSSISGASLLITAACSCCGTADRAAAPANKKTNRQNLSIFTARLYRASSAVNLHQLTVVKPVLPLASPQDR